MKILKLNAISPVADEVFKGYARYGLGFNNWRGLCICGNGISSGTPLTA